jgi:hypothetical protein
VLTVEHEVDEAGRHFPLDRRVRVRNALQLDAPRGEEREHILHNLGSGARGRGRIGHHLLEEETFDEREEAREREFDEAALPHTLLRGHLLPGELVPVQLLRLLEEEESPLLGEPAGRRRRLQVALEQPGEAGPAAGEELAASFERMAGGLLHESAALGSVQR